MKQFLSLVLASALGATVTIGVFSFSDTKSSQDLNAKAHQVNMKPVLGSLAALDFVDASEKATQAVVHIYAEESSILAQQRLEEQQQNRRNRRRNTNPFFEDFFSIEDFFGGDMFGGRNFYQPRNGSGSGVIISEDGYIVTNNHVVGFADLIEVTLFDGRKVKAQKIGTDPSTDLAVLKIEDDNLPTLAFSDSDRVRVGEWVLAVGNPFDLTSTVTAGIVSAKGRDLDLIKEKQSIEEFIQTDAAVNPGNSGGALVNTDGKLVGVNTAIATPTGVYAGYSFAIPSNLVKRIVYDIIENGNIERASLGIGGYSVDASLVEELGLSIDYGVYVSEVDERSSAQFAGVLPGDVIIGVEDIRIMNFDDIKESLKYTKVGDTLKLTLIRDDMTKTIDVKLRRKV